MKLENILLKGDVTNKQKFIDTLLQRNSKLSQKFDIISIISVTNEARKQPHGRQNYKKKIPSWIIDKNKKEIYQARKVMKIMEVPKKNIDHQKNLHCTENEVLHYGFLQ